MVKRKFKLDGWQIITLFVAFYFILFFVYPLLSILTSSVWDSSTKSFDFSNFKLFFTTKFYLNTIKNSLYVSVSASAIATLIGTVFAYFTRTIKIKFKRIIDMLLMISIISPPFLGAYSWIILLGRVGIITNLINSWFGIEYGGIYGFSGILLVFSLKMIPLVYLYVSGALRNVDNSLIEASENLGCRGPKKFFKVILPLILPTILSSGILVFMRILSDFGTPQLIGEGYRTLPVLIYNMFASEVVTNRPLAATVAVIVIIITLLLFLLQRWFSERKTIEMSALRPIEPKKIKGIKNILLHGFIYFIVFLAILPTAVILINSFLKSSGRVLIGGVTLENYQKAFTIVWKPLKNTIIFSLIALVIIIIIGVIVAYTSVRRKSKINGFLDIISMFPYIIPGTVLGLALLVSFSGKPFALAATATIIIISYSVRRLPYTIRSTSAILYQIDKSVDEASLSLGASSFKTFFKVTTPMMWTGVLSGAIMSWLSIITEISASIVLYSFRTKTLTIEIFNRVSEGEYGVASALSAFLTIITIIALVFSLKLSGNKDLSL